MGDLVKLNNNQLEDLEKWKADTNNTIINYTDSTEDLKQQMIDWKQLTYKQRRVSDWKAQELYGMTNQDYYNALNANLLKNDETEVPIPSNDEKIETIKENFILTKNDYGQNLDLWKAGTDNNILYVTGLSGSGKTTKASELSRYKKAIYVELDLFEHNDYLTKNDAKGAQLFKVYFNNIKPDIKNKLKTMNNEDFTYEFCLFFDWLISYIKKDKRNLYIVEGVQLFYHISPAFFKDKPLIVKGTSLIDSMIRRFKRNNNGTVDWLNEIKNDLPGLFKWYMGNEKDLNTFKKGLNEDGNITVINTAPKVQNLNIRFDNNKIEDAQEYQADSMNIIMIPNLALTLDEIEDMWNKWNQMTHKHRRESDWKAQELFGVDNKTIYEYLKSKELENTLTNVKISKDDIKTDNIESEEIKSVDDFMDDIEKEFVQESVDTLRVSSMCMDLANIDKTNLPFSKTIEINKCIENSVIRLNNKSEASSLIPNELPYFNTDELKLIDIDYSSSNDRDFSSIWFAEYDSLLKGFKSETFSENFSKWKTKVMQLSMKLFAAGEEQREAIKEEIIKLGWNSEIEFNRDNLIRSADRVKSMMNEYNIIDMTKLSVNVPDRIITENSNDDKVIYPVYIVLVYTGTKFGKAVVKFTGSKYSHSAIGLEPDLKNLYSYNMNKIYNGGFSFESIDKYKQNNPQAIMQVSCIFVNKKDLLKIKSKLDYYIANRADTSYSAKNIFGIMLNKPFEGDLNMICSQFVDSMLKMVNKDITHKSSGLSMPDDFYKSDSSNIYRLFEGNIGDYDAKKTKTLVDKISKKNKSIKESKFEIVDESSCIQSICENIYNLDSLLILDESASLLTGRNKVIYESYIKPRLHAKVLYETKEFPVQFDKDGNLLIEKYKTMDHEMEYQHSHRLLSTYEKTNNIDGMKYELCKLYFINLLLEKKINKNNKDMKRHIDIRARVLNDFNKYLKIISDNDKSFNFTEYYNSTPFSDVKIKINNSTLKYSGEILKQILL